MLFSVGETLLGDSDAVNIPAHQAPWKPSYFATISLPPDAGWIDLGVETVFHRFRTNLHTNFHF